MHVFLRSKVFHWFLILCFSQLVLMEPLYAVEEQVTAINVNHSVTGSDVRITYDLQGKPDEYASLTLVMLKHNDAGFRYFPKDVSGDIGTVQAGGQKTVTWDLRSEFPAGLASEDIYFSLQSTNEEENSVGPWLWIGVVVVIGVVVYFLVKKSQDEGSKDFPQPPGRP